MASANAETGNVCAPIAIEVDSLLRTASVEVACISRLEFYFADARRRPEKEGQEPHRMGLLPLAPVL